MVTISLAIARFGQKASLAFYPHKTSSRRGRRPEPADLFPCSHTPDAIIAFYAMLSLGMFLLNFLAIVSLVGLMILLQAAGVDQSSIDAGGRWLWPLVIGAIIFNGYAGIRHDLAERPEWGRRIPPALRVPSDLHLFIALLSGLPFIFLANPFLTPV
jgi:hypothetical protein